MEHHFKTYFLYAQFYKRHVISVTLQKTQKVKVDDFTKEKL